MLSYGSNIKAIALACVCGRSFSLPGALTKHKQSCKSSKKRLAGVLDVAKKLWKESKRRRFHQFHGQADVTGQMSPSAEQVAVAGLIPDCQVLTQDLPQVRKTDDKIPPNC